MSTETLLPTSTPTPTPEPTRSTAARKITCGYCDCVLADDGGVLRSSERVKALNKQEETIEKLRSDLTKAQDALTTVQAELTSAKDAIAAAQRKGFAIDWED